MYHIQSGKGYYFKGWRGDEPRYTTNTKEAFWSFNKATCDNVILAINAWVERSGLNLSHQIVNV